MPSEIIQQDLNEIFRATFMDDSIVVTRDMTAEDVDGWDSLNNIRMLVAVEQHFGVKFGALEIESLDTVGKLMDLIETKQS